MNLNNYKIDYSERDDKHFSIKENLISFKKMIKYFFTFKTQALSVA